MVFYKSEIVMVYRSKPYKVGKFTNIQHGKVATDLLSSTIIAYTRSVHETVIPDIHVDFAVR